MLGVQRSDLKTADDALTRAQPGAVPPCTKEAVCSGERDGGTGVETWACHDSSKAVSGVGTAGGCGSALTVSWVLRKGIAGTTVGFDQEPSGPTTGGGEGFGGEGEGGGGGAGDGGGGGEGGGGEGWGGGGEG